MKIFRDRFDLHLSTGQNQTKYETLYRSQIDRFPAKLTNDNIDGYFSSVYEVKINIAHTPIQPILSDRYISDIILAALKKPQASQNFQALGHSLSNDPSRYDLMYLQSRITAEIDPTLLSDATPANDPAPSNSSPLDAPAAFITDRQPRAGGKWGRTSRNR